MSSSRKWKKTVDSDDEAPLFPEGWAPKAQRVDSDDEVPLFSEGCKRNAKRMRIEKTLEKSVPKSTRLDRALGRIAGGSSRSKPDATFTTGEHGRQIDNSDHIREDASARQQHRVTGDSAWYEQWNAKVAEHTRQVAARAAYSVSWIDCNRPGRL